MNPSENRHPSENRPRNYFKNLSFDELAEFLTYLGWETLVPDDSSLNLPPIYVNHCLFWVHPTYSMIYSPDENWKTWKCNVIGLEPKYTGYPRYGYAIVQPTPELEDYRTRQIEIAQTLANIASITLTELVLQHRLSLADTGEQEKEIIRDALSILNFQLKA